MHVESGEHSTVDQTCHVFIQNVGLHNDERLAEALAQVSSMQWDIIIFPETKSSHDIVEPNDRFQSHVCFGIGKETRAAGVAILMHAQHKKSEKRKVVLSGKVLYLDVQFGKERVESLQQHATHSTCRLFRAGFYQFFRTLT